MRRRLLSLLLVFAMVFSLMAPAFAGQNGESGGTEDGGDRVTNFFVSASDGWIYGMRLTSYQVDENGDIIEGSRKTLNVMKSQTELDKIKYWSSHSVIDHCLAYSESNKHMTAAEMGFRSGKVDSTWISATLDSATQAIVDKATSGDRDDGGTSGGTDEEESVFDLTCITAEWKTNSHFDSSKWPDLMDGLKELGESAASSNPTIKAIQNFMSGYTATDDRTTSTSTEDTYFYIIGEPLILLHTPDNGIACVTLNELYNLRNEDWGKSEYTDGHYSLGINSVFKNLARIGHLVEPFSDYYERVGHVVPNWSKLNGVYNYKYGEFTSTPPFDDSASTLIDASLTSDSDCMRYSGVIDFTSVLDGVAGPGALCSMYYSLSLDKFGNVTLKYMDTEVTELNYNEFEIVRSQGLPMEHTATLKMIDADFVGEYEYEGITYKAVLNDAISGAVTDGDDFSTLQKALENARWDYTLSNFVLPETYMDLVDTDYYYGDSIDAYSGALPGLGLAYGESAEIKDTTLRSFQNLPTFKFAPTPDFYDNALLVGNIGTFDPFELWGPVVEGMKSKVPNIDAYTVWYHRFNSDQVYSMDISQFVHPFQLSDASPAPAGQIFYLKYICVPEQFQHNYLEVVDQNGNPLSFMYLDKDFLNYEGASGVLRIQDIAVDSLLYANVDPATLELKSVYSIPVIDTVYGSEAELLSAGSLESHSGDLGAYYVNNWPAAVIPYEAACVWKVEADVSKAETSDVPQWRLSKYFEEELSGLPSMQLLGVTRGRGCLTNWATLTPSGVYDYDLIYPDGMRYTVEEAQDRTRLLMDNRWLQVRMYGTVLQSPNIDNPWARVSTKLDLLVVKTTDTSGIKAAKWLDSPKSGIGLRDLNTDYEVENDILPGSPSADVYEKKIEPMSWRTVNNSTYTNWYSVYNHIPVYGGYLCGCYMDLAVRGPQYYPSYVDYSVSISRLVAVPSSGASFSAKVDQEAGSLALRYRYGTLGIYPEYGLLFDTNKGPDEEDSSIVWAVGDVKRDIGSTVYQTLQYKAYVTPTISGTSVATDSRAITKAGSMGFGRLPVIYKGAGVASLYKLNNKQGSDSAALLTVKSYVLDFVSDGTVKTLDLKNAWGNGSYDSFAVHQKLYDEIKDNNKAETVSRLLISSAVNSGLKYTGGDVKGYAELTPVSYSSHARKVSDGSAVKFEHQLIIRNGLLIGVRYMDHSSFTQTAMTMSQLKSKDEALYKALIEMGLYSETNNRSATVLSGLVHNGGNTLDESEYVSRLADSRRLIDGITTPSDAAAHVGKGWYGEDTTVLSVFEYVSNFTLPGVTASDKISLSVPGLETPANKREFFGTMFYGHNYLRYGLKLKASVLSSDLDDTEVYFEYSSYKGDGYGAAKYNTGVREPNYLVPNVSVTDSTRLS